MLLPLILYNCLILFHSCSYYAHFYCCVRFCNTCRYHHHQDAYKYLPNICKSDSYIFSKYYLWSVNNQKMKIFFFIDLLLWPLNVTGSKREFCEFCESYDFRHKIDFIWFQNVIWVIKPSINAISTKKQLR